MRGRKWREYQKAMTARGIRVAPGWVPSPIESNKTAWDAFLRLKNCRKIAMFGAGGFEWQDIAVRLSVRGEWSADMERRLAICEDEMLRVEERIRGQK